MMYFYACISLLAGLGAFLLGFRLVSEYMQKRTAGRFLALIAKSDRSKAYGAMLGTACTTAVQSSTVTTVMAVNLVNAGSLTLSGAAAIIMGANVGSTLTGIIAALGAFDFASVAILLVFVGAILYIFSTKKNVKESGFALAFFGIIFMGLKLMRESMNVFCENTFISDALSTFTNPFVLLLIGMLFTALIQSSSVITSVIISMAAAGLTVGGGGNAALYVILGANVGTCITAIISSFGTSVNARRAALIHLLFNVFSAVVFLPPLLLYDGFCDKLLAKWFTSPQMQIAMFHTLSNVICTLLFLPFTNAFVRLANLLIKNPPQKAPALSI